MTIKVEDKDWGTVYHMKEKYYKFALYVYNDDNNTVYLSNVKVSPVMRNRGLGNELLSVAEMWAKKIR